ncbi:MAG TPA: AAA family ATPase, partial [Nocardioides sp.]|nr:AAA family ATPase [Nocardioides sp.]
MTGRGSTALVLGEAGIGKTSLVRELLASLPREVRVLAAGCEDLLTPRTLGALRDAVRGRGGPLAEALTSDADQDAVFAAVLAELGSGAPTVLVVDDAHWADGATLDVLRFLGRKIVDLPAMLLLTYRDDEVDDGHPLRTVLGGMTGADTVRLRLAPLTVEGVTELAGGAEVDATELFRLTQGNPFFVTEVLATAPDTIVPPTVVDAVLARVGKLSPQSQSAVKRLAIVPGGIEVGLLRMLQPDLTPVGEAEAAGVLTVRGDILRFRHELARRTVAENVPVSLRMGLHADVLRALLTDPEPDPFRVLHHAVAAGDDDLVVSYGRLAGRAAARAGAHRQAAACFALVLARGVLLTPAQRGRIGEAYAWALSNSNELQAAAAAAATAVEEWRLVDGDSRLVRALATLSRQQWLTEDTAKARSSAELAMQLAQTQGDTLDHALALLNLGGVLVLVDQELAGMQQLRTGIDLAQRLGASDIETLATNYLGSAKLQLGDLDGRVDLLRSRDQAQEMANHEFVMRAYYNLTEGLWRLGRYDEALAYIEEGEAYGADHDFQVYAYMFDARRYRRLAMLGRWAEAVTGLRGMLDG